MLAWPTTLKLFRRRIPWLAPMTTRSPRSIASTRLAPIWLAPLAKWKGFTPSDRGKRMSVEIEVGLENAAKVKPVPQEEIFLDEPPKGLKNPKVRRLLVVGAVVLLALAVGLFIYYHNRES